MMRDFIRPKHLGLQDQDAKDGLINVANVKKGDRFYECHHNWGNIEVVALDDARWAEGGWMCRVKDRTNAEHDIFVSANTLHHGPNFYSLPQILDQNEEGEVGYYVQ